MKRKIEVGFTNTEKFVIDEKEFEFKKNYTGFNHGLDYTKLKQFDFVPTLIFNDPVTMRWDYIKGDCLNKPTNEDLAKVATILRTVHKSNLKLPNNNLRRRIAKYVEIINQKNKKIDVINLFYREIQTTLNNMRNINPVHNDVWSENIIKRQTDGKLFLVDWEYATMGDKHFDLAFYISSDRLTKEEEEVFLEAYNKVDGEISYDPNFLFRHKRLCNYLTICWAHAQEDLPFDTKPLEEFLIKTKNLKQQ